MGACLPSQAKRRLRKHLLAEPFCYCSGNLFPARLSRDAGAAKRAGAAPGGAARLSRCYSGLSRRAIFSSRSFISSLMRVILRSSSLIIVEPAWLLTLKKPMLFS